jgi:hypothetical protein
MPCRGVFFAITAEQAAALEAAPDDAALMEVVEKIESAWDADNLAECDKSWDAMHRALTDGTTDFGSGTEPLRHCVLGPHQLHRGDDYIISVVAPKKVRELSQALAAITRPWFEERYWTQVPREYSPNYGTEDLEYTWVWFECVRDLYRKAEERGRFVVFTVSQ